MDDSLFAQTQVRPDDPRSRAEMAPKKTGYSHYGPESCLYWGLRWRRLSVSRFIFATGGTQETHLQAVRVYGGLLMALGFGLIGFMDDYISVVKKRNMGLNERQKMIMQFLVAGAYLLSLYVAGDTSAMVIPFVGTVDWGIALLNHRLAGDCRHEQRRQFYGRH